MVNGINSQKMREPFFDVPLTDKNSSKPDFIDKHCADAMRNVSKSKIRLGLTAATSDVAFYTIVPLLLLYFAKIK
jgi:hypothetical protein